MPVVRAPFFAAGPREAVVLERLLRDEIRRYEHRNGSKVERWIAEMRDGLEDVAKLGRREALMSLSEHARELPERTREHPSERFRSLAVEGQISGGPVSEPEGLLSTKDVSGVLGVTPRAVQRLVRRGSLRLSGRGGGRALRFDPVDVHRFVEERARRRQAAQREDNGTGDDDGGDPSVENAHFQTLVEEHPVLGWWPSGGGRSGTR
jgi:hypothetical protein